MRACGHESFHSFLPLSLSYLRNSYPTTIANKKLDRSIFRCKLCGLIKANEAGAEAEIPLQRLKDSITETQNRIRAAEGHVTHVNKLVHSDEAGDLSKEGLKGALTQVEINLAADKKQLSQLMTRHAEAEEAMDLDILHTWAEYLAIWGAGEGPDRESEVGCHEDLETPAAECLTLAMEA